jgi:hypothetical protein
MNLDSDMLVDHQCRFSSGVVVSPVPGCYNRAHSSDMRATSPLLHAHAHARKHCPLRILKR